MANFSPLLLEEENALFLRASKPKRATIADCSFFVSLVAGARLELTTFGL